MTWRAIFTRGPPWLASAAIWLSRTLTIANSDATKKPLRKTRKKTVRIWRIAISIGTQSERRDSPAAAIEVGIFVQLRLLRYPYNSLLSELHRSESMPLRIADKR